MLLLGRINGGGISLFLHDDFKVCYKELFLAFSIFSLFAQYLFLHSIKAAFMWLFKTLRNILHLLSLFL